jgi:hypothetical protein
MLPTFNLGNRSGVFLEMPRKFAAKPQSVLGIEVNANGVTGIPPGSAPK